MFAVVATTKIVSVGLRVPVVVLARLRLSVEIVMMGEVSWPRSVEVSLHYNTAQVGSTYSFW